MISPKSRSKNAPSASTRSARKGGGAERSMLVEPLEARIAPATFTGASGTLTIDLDSANEVISLHTDGTIITATLLNGMATDGGTGGNVMIDPFSGMVALITSAAYTTINITDSSTGNSVSFQPSTGAYGQAFSITLDESSAGNLTFSGSSTFPSSLSATLSAGFVASDLSSSITAATLSLVAVGHDVLMAGAVSVSGTTSITARVIQLDNVANDFMGTLQLQGTAAASVNDVNDLSLAASIFDFGTVAQKVSITAGGTISQTGALTATGSSGSMLSIASTGGSITLTGANNISNNVAVALSVTGSNAISFTNSPGANTNLMLADVSLGTGALTLVSNGSIVQGAGSTIHTDGPVSLSVATNNRDIILSNAGNHMGGTITVGETGAGFLRDLNIRNAADNVLPPVGTPLSTANDVRNLTITFDNTGIGLPAYIISGNLSVTAGGEITQTGAQSIGGNSTFTVIGDHGILLTNPANAFMGAVSFRAPQSTLPIQLVGTGGITLGTSDLGRGALSVVAVTGSINQTGALVQEKGAADATYTVTAGTAINLSNSGNLLTGRQIFVGAGLTTLNVRNADPTADFGDLTYPATTVDTLTVRFDNAAVALPSLGTSGNPLDSLTVTAPGIVQAAGTAIFATDATFDSREFPLDLSNTGNDFNNITLKNSGRNDVTVTDIDDLNFAGTSNIGSGRLTVSAGAITDSGKISQGSGPVGDVSFTSSGTIQLDFGHAFRGTVNVTAANSTVISNSNTPLFLGTITAGAGTFTAIATNAGIFQDPSSVLNLVGNSNFTATGGGQILLNQSKNTFTGEVSLSGGDISLNAVGAVILGAGGASNLTVKTGGEAAHSITQTGAFTVSGTSVFDAGAASITLTNTSNNFNRVGFFSTGSSVAITDTNGLGIVDSVVGGGTVTLTTGGNITTFGSLVQTTGTGAITLDTPAVNNITLNSSANVFLGPVNVIHATNINIRSMGDLTFSGGSAVTGDLTASAGGALTLPTVLNNLTRLSVSANSTIISSDIAVTSGNVVIFGKASFVGDRSITATSSDITFHNGLDAGGALTFTLGNGQQVNLTGGDWNQGTNALTINGSGVDLVIGGSAPASFNMTAGLISIPGGGDVVVVSNATFRVGDTSAVEVVRLENGDGLLTFGAGSTFAVGFGAMNDQLVKAGSSTIIVNSSAKLVGSGLAGSVATPVLVSETGLLTGRFFHSVDSDGAAHDFFAGSDIVTPTYDFPALSVKAGGTESTNGSVSGFMADGDKFVVTASGGANAKLVVSKEIDGTLAAVVRNNTSDATVQFTVTCTKSAGDGFIDMSGVAIHTPSSAKIKINAANVNFTGSIVTEGTLASLTARDLGVAGELTISGGGAASKTTSITAREMDNVQIDLAGVLSTLTVRSATSGTVITADKFGTIKSTADAATSNPGDFGATLISTTTSDGKVLNSATIAGDLTGRWDLRGSVGTVTAKESSGFTFGTAPGSTAFNGGLLSSVTSANLGVVSDLRLNASGRVNTVTCKAMTDSILKAGSFGSITTTGDSAKGIFGNLSSTVITATGNANGVGLGTLKVKGDIENSSVDILDGNVTTISAGGLVSGLDFVANDINGHGTVVTIQAGAWDSNSVDARSVGTMKITGNLSAGLFGDFTQSSVTLHGATKGNTLGTFSATGMVDSSTFDIEHGGVGAFTVTRELSNSQVRLTDSDTGTLKTLSAGALTNNLILAKSIGTLKTTGAAASNPRSPLLIGDVDSTTIDTYLNGGTTPSIGTISISGGLISSNIAAENGITTLTVKRSVDDSFIAADNPTAGRINSITIGAWFDSAVSGTTIGTVKTTGFSTPEDSSNPFTPGDVIDTQILAHGGSSTKVGIGTVSIAGELNTSTVSAPFGITTVSVGSAYQGSQIFADNALTPTAGAIKTLTAGAIINANTRAGSLGTVKVAAKAGSGLLADVSNSTISATAAVKTAIGTLSVGGDFVNSTVDAAGSVTTITIAGQMVSAGASNRINAGYAPGSNLSTFTAGSINGTSSITSNVVSQAISTFKLIGNASRGFAGTAQNAFIDILGSNTKGVGLGTFSAAGEVTDSLVRVNDGDVTSFAVARMDSSDLLVGFRFDQADDITATTNVAQWTATNHKIGTFKTTGIFDANDVEDTATFVDSNVIAGILGSITVGGVNPETIESTAFGIAFRTAAGATAKGTVKVKGTALTAPSTDGQFNYLGLAG